MSRVKCVTRTLLALGKSAQASVLAQIFESALSSAQDLMCVSLVADIPDHLVPRKIEHPIQCDRQLDNAEIGCKMTAGMTDLINQEITNFTGQDLHLRIRQFLYITRFIDFFQYHLILVPLHINFFTVLLKKYVNKLFSLYHTALLSPTKISIN